MQNMIQNWFKALWSMTGEMAPWLMLGFALAALLKAFLPKNLASKHLSATDSWAPLKASLLGMPMPLCSCSVIPVAAHLRKTGAGSKASLSFLTSTPTNGLDSMLPTYAFLGPVFMILRPIFAFVSGLFASFWIKEEDTVIQPNPPIDEAALPLIQRLKNGFSYAFGDLFRDTRPWLLLGLVLAATIEVAIPSNFWLSQSLWLNYGLILIIATPMYVCSTGSLPIAAALMGKGLSAGAAFLFITLGPATSTATIAFVFGTFGRKNGIKWLASLMLLALITAIAVDTLIPLEYFQNRSANHMHQTESLWTALGTILFLLLLIHSFLKDFSFKKNHFHSSSGEKMNQYTYTVPDMSCGNCARSIENQLNSAGCTLINKDLVSKEIKVSATLTQAEVAEILTKAGFKPQD